MSGDWATIEELPNALVEIVQVPIVIWPLQIEAALDVHQYGLDEGAGIRDGAIVVTFV